MKSKQYIADLHPYQPGLPIEVVARRYNLKPGQIIKLASNENPLGMSPKAKAALIRSLSGIHRYPDQYHLTQKLAQKFTVDPKMIVLGSGSNDVLDLVARAFLGTGDEAILSAYAFPVYAIATQSAGATKVIVPAKDFGHDLPAMAKAITPKTRVIWIANPNNPTGTFISYGEVEQFLRQVPKRVAVVLDEAYCEYLEDVDRKDTTRWLQAHPNLIITRTFSKIYGLAGLRVGYGLATSQIIELLQRVRLPFNVTVPALSAAIAALDDDDFMTRSRTVNTQGKKQLRTGLAKLGLEHLPAYGNFVTFKVTDASSVHERLLSQGVILRPLAANGLPEWLRVTIGTQADNRRFLQAMEQALTFV